MSKVLDNIQAASNAAKTATDYQSVMESARAACKALAVAKAKKARNDKNGRKAVQADIDSIRSIQDRAGSKLFTLTKGSKRAFLMGKVGNRHSVAVYKKIPKPKKQELHKSTKKAAKK